MDWKMFRESVKVEEKKKLLLSVKFIKLVWFVQKYKEKLFPFVKGVIKTKSAKIFALFFFFYFDPFP